MTPPPRVLAAFCLLALALLVVPAASAVPQPTYCINKSCPPGYAVVVDAAGHHADACVIGVHGSCQPYDGDLVRVHLDGREYRVPDPCYTTYCI